MTEPAQVKTTDPGPRDGPSPPNNEADEVPKARQGSLPSLHPLRTIPETPSNAPVIAVPGPGAYHSRRAASFRNPVVPYPDTPYSWTSPPSSFPYTPRATGSSAASPSFFIWPFPRPVSKRKSNNSLLPSATPVAALPPSYTFPLPPLSTVPAAVQQPPPAPGTQDDTTTTDNSTTKKQQDHQQQQHPPIHSLTSPAASHVTTAELAHELRLAERRRVAEFPRRLGTALFGGVAVIVPMVIMSLDSSLTKSLITSSVAVLSFGVVLAWTSTADEASLLVATAGYAAVLAVFVAVGDGDG